MSEETKAQETQTEEQIEEQKVDLDGMEQLKKEIDEVAKKSALGHNMRAEQPDDNITVDDVTYIQFKSVEYDALIADAELRVAQLKAERAKVIYEKNLDILKKLDAEAKLKQRIEQQMRSQVATK